MIDDVSTRLARLLTQPIALLPTPAPDSLSLPPMQLAAASTGASLPSQRAINDLDRGIGAYGAPPVAPVAPVAPRASGFFAPVDATKTFRGPQGQPLDEAGYKAMLKAREKLWQSNPAPAAP